MAIAGRVSVIGAGIFGVTVAIKLARAGFRVRIFDCNDDILNAASGINQYRLHMGYHYPRSEETRRLCIQSMPGFLEEFGSTLVPGFTHYYGIPKNGSLTSAADCEKIWSQAGLWFEKQPPDSIVNPDSLSGWYQVHERAFDPHAMRRLCWSKLRESGVEVILGLAMTPGELPSGEAKIVACYYRNNRLVKGPRSQLLQRFQVCEKSVLRLPDRFAGRSVVLVDGPFMCFDPFGSTGLHVCGHVKHAIHVTNTGYEASIPSELRPLLDRGLIMKPTITQVPNILREAAQYFPGAEQFDHVGSMYTVRAVPANREFDDLRPSDVYLDDEGTIVMFSGKVGTSVFLADIVVRHLRDGVALPRQSPDFCAA